VSVTRRVLNLAAGAAGVAAAGAAAAGAARMAQQRRELRNRGGGDDVPFGSLRSRPITVIADDGVPLHVEVDEVETVTRGRRGSAAPPITVVFIHGYALNLDCWHFQRAGLRGLVRTVYYDQRSHGRSGRSDDEHTNLDQLGRDLMRVLEDITHDEPVVLVGHSMGGMSILSLADQRPDLFGTKVVGVGLWSTTAGGLDPGRILFPILPAGLGGGVVGRAVGALSRSSRTVDRVRRLGKDVALVLTDTYAFGDDVPETYVEFVYDMLDATPFDVVAHFFPSFAALDRWDAAAVLSSVPTSIVCGTEDRITHLNHSRKLHSRIHGSELFEAVGAGHMVIIERHEEVNRELDDLLDLALARVAAS